MIMILSLFWLSLVHTFGRASMRPSLTAASRLSFLSASSLALSWFFGQATAQIPFQSTTKLWLVSVWIAIAAYACAGLSYLASSGLYKGSDTFSQLLLTWPIAPWLHGLAVMAPRLVIGLLGMVLISLPTTIIARGLNLHPMISIALLLIGYGAATLSYIAVVHGLRHLPGRTASNQVRFLVRSSSIWFFKKAWRSPSITISMLTALSLSTLAAGFAYYRTFTDLAALSLVGALLCASFCADLRSLSRRHNPVEIAGLKGTAHFMHWHFLAAVCGTVVIALPLLVVAAHTDQPIQAWCAALSQLVAGCAAGFLSGTTIAPEARDVSSQFTSVLLCIVLLFLPSYIPYMQSFNQVQNAYVLILIGGLCIAITYIIEHKRNPYNWKNNWRNQP